MKTNLSEPTIKTNSTFLRLSTGASTIADVLAQRAAARAMEDSFVRRHKDLAARADLFNATFCR